MKFFNILGGKLLTYCDNQSVVQKLKTGWNMWRYRHTKGADGDLQALLCQTINDLQKTRAFHYTPEWIKGHQDGDPASRVLSRPAALNVRMDQDTKEAYNLPTQWITDSFMPVLQAEGCAVYINNNKVTSRMQLSLQERWHEREAREYLQQRHGISSAIFDTINWRSMRFALKKLRPHRRATAIKAIHRHLPTNDKLFQQNRVVMSSLCPRCVSAEETNSHIYCCPNEEAFKQRRVDWQELWKHLQKCRTASVIEQTWRFHLQPLVDIPLGDSIIDGLTIAHGEVAELLELAVNEQAIIGWDKLLLGMGSSTWILIQDRIDDGNPNRPERTASDWLNSAIHHLLKFSIRCWKTHNTMIHGASKLEQHQIALQHAREKITAIYNNPPSLAPHFRSIFEIPLDHRLKMPLQAAEQWLSLISHQVKVTQHNFKVLLRQHKPMQDHLRHMRRETSRQAKERNLPATPRKEHSRAVQAAVCEMKA